MNQPIGELSTGDDNVLPARDNGTNRMLMSIAVIAVGGAIGSLLRWYFSTRWNAHYPQLPPGTLAANLIGGYLIGVAMAVFLAYPGLSPQWRLLIVTGFLGGLTTFSTFSAEVSTALMAGRSLWALVTVAVHVIGSIVMTLCGVGTVRLLRSLLG